MRYVLLVLFMMGYTFVIGYVFADPSPFWFKRKTTSTPDGSEFSTDNGTLISETGKNVTLQNGTTMDVPTMRPPPKVNQRPQPGVQRPLPPQQPTSVNPKGQPQPSPPKAQQQPPAVSGDPRPPVTGLPPGAKPAGLLDDSQPTKNTNVKSPASGNKQPPNANAGGRNLHR